MKIDLPISVKVGKQNCSLNLNYYRNAHFQILNKMKIAFADQIKDQLSNLPVYKTINLQYILYPKTKRLCDVANICSIVDKFFCDALVSAKKLEDDNYTYLSKVSYEFGEVDKDNPRVTVIIDGIQ